MRCKILNRIEDFYIMSVITKLFGTRSEREVKKLEKTVEAIEALSAFDADTEALRDYALALAKRNK